MIVGETAQADPHQRANPTTYAWSVVGLLFIVALLNYLDRLSITTVREPIRADIPMSDKGFGLLTSAFLWSYAAVSPLGGFVADRVGRRIVIIISLLFWSIATCLTGLATSFPQILLARLLMGVSEACYIPAALALVTDYHRGPTRSLATGLHMTGIYAGAALGGVGAVMAEHFGWRLGFKLLGAFGIVYSFVLLLVLRDAKKSLPPKSRESLEPGCISPVGPKVRDRASGTTGAARPGSNRGVDVGPAGAVRSQALGYTSGTIPARLFTPGFRALLAVNLLFGVVNWTVYGWLPTFLRDRFKLGLGAAGLSATAYIQAASFIGVLIAGVVADRWSRSNRKARALTPALGLLLGGPFLVAAASSHLLPFAIFGLIIFGLGRGAVDANQMPLLREVIDDRYCAFGYGLFNFVSTTAGGVMVYAGGALLDAHIDLERIFQTAGAGIFLAGVILLFIPLPRYLVDRPR